MKKFISIAILLILISSFVHVFRLTGSIMTNKLAYASINEDHEDEDEEDREDDEDEDDDDRDDDDDQYESVPTTPTKEEDEVEYETVIVPAEPTYTNVWVVDPGYNIDTDGDGLVDAIDPDPNVKQTLFFTDSDSDGVADAFDVYPGDDDFTYTSDTDENGNGIVDSME